MARKITSSWHPYTQRNISQQAFTLLGDYHGKPYVFHQVPENGEECVKVATALVTFRLSGPLGSHLLRR